MDYAGANLAVVRPLDLAGGGTMYWLWLFSCWAMDVWCYFPCGVPSLWFLSALVFSLLSSRVRTSVFVPISHCVFRGCVGIGVRRHAFHLAQILRVRATRAQCVRSPSRCLRFGSGLNVKRLRVGGKRFR